MPVQPPTETQLRFARNIASALRLSLGTAEHDRKACSDFISQHRTDFYAHAANRAPEPAQATRQPAPMARQPSAAQLKLATALHEQLKNDPAWPALEKSYARAARSLQACSEFIQLAQARQSELSYLRNLNALEVISAALRQELHRAADVTVRNDILRRFKAAPRPPDNTDLPPTPLLALSAYWSQAIAQAAFTSLATADNQLGDNKAASFSLATLPRALETAVSTELAPQGDEVTVRHLLMRLTKTIAGQQKMPEHTVLCVLPLQAYLDTSPRGYRWGRALKELPRFNRELIGEEARIEGLHLSNVDALDEYLESLADDMEKTAPQAPAGPTLAQAWQLLDDCFRCLTSADGNALGASEWISALSDPRYKPRALRNTAITFALVEASSATGSTRQVANVLAQLQADPELLDTPALALMRSVAGFEQASARGFDGKAKPSDLMLYSGHMDSRKKERREAYPLDPAQRDALLAMQQLRHGQLLAVNGPPGTGKTSLLRAVIATTWIAPLLDADCDRPAAPFILACAATNQAVTNIISSFDETPGPGLFDAHGEPTPGTRVTMESRWLPWLVSYGWYAPAGATDASFDRYQQIKRKSPSQPWQFAGACAGLSDLSPENARRVFLDCASRFLGSELSLDNALAGLRARMKTQWLAVSAIEGAASQWLTRLAALAAFTATGYRDAPQQGLQRELELRHKRQDRAIERLQTHVGRLDATRRKLERGLQLAGTPRTAVATLQLVAAAPEHPAALDFTLQADIEQQLAGLQNEIQKRLQGNLLERLLEHGRTLLNPQQVAAEHQALVSAAHQLGVNVNTPGGSGLLKVHQAIGAHRLQLAASLEGLARQLLEIHLLAQGAGQPANAQQLSLQLSAKLAATEQEYDLSHAERQLKVRELDATRQALTEVKARRDNYLALLRDAERARDALLEALQGDRTPHPLTATIAQLLTTALAEVEGAPQAHTSSLLKCLQDRLDTHERLRLFHLAARYWEGRYIDEALTQLESARADPAFRPSSSRQLRHLAMLGPVFVATAASAPKLMRRALGPDDSDQPPYLFGEADLLIVDEAGQATPEGCITSFAFASRAIVVGDVDQLAPVWSIDRASDCLLVKRYGLQRFAPGGEEDPMVRLNACGLLVSRGSIMLAAQNATAVTTAGAAQRGLTLTNHYRCLAPIIDICNRMVYRGALTCATPAPKSIWQPQLSRLAYLLVPDCGETRQAEGSRANATEARLIARWLRENGPSMLAHFAPAGDRTLADLVGIVTPYKAQTRQLRSAIADAFEESQDEPGEGPETRLHIKMTIGTVHSLQGAEKEIVIFSMVDTQTPKEAQFYDRRHDLINVAVSRAKHMLITALSRDALSHGLQLTDRALAQGKPSDYLMHAMARHGSRLNAQKIVVVESPNKCHTIHQALGGRLEYLVLATGGHLRQLKPPHMWDASTADEPQWGPVSPSGLQLLDELQFLWPGLLAMYVATDADAEGETIAWHVLDLLSGRLRQQLGTGTAARVRRMRFNTLRPPDIQAAMEDAGEGLDQGLVKSALARALLDHLVAGHLPVRLGLSPQPGLHAGVGRVQLGILDLVQRQVRAPVLHEVHMRLPWDEGSYAPLVLDGQPVSFKSVADANAQADELQHTRAAFSPHWSLATRSRLEQIHGLPVVNTASLMALAHRAHGLAPQRTLAALQELYEAGASAATTAEVDHD